MKIYVIIATALSVLFGFLPIYIAKFTHQGDELCDPDLYYSAERVCVLMWDRSLIFFSLYFAIAVAFFIAMFLFWNLLMWLLKACGL